MRSVATRKERRSLQCAFERHRSGVKRIVIRLLNFSSNFWFCNLPELILNTISVLYSQFTKETQHKVVKSKNRRISANNRLYVKPLKPQTAERVSFKKNTVGRRINNMQFFRYLAVRVVRGSLKGASHSYLSIHA